MKTIGIIDCGLGNILSVEKMLLRAGGRPVISGDVAALKDCSALILPGVGTYDFGMNRLREKGLVEFLKKRILDEKVPILGICLGMQLLFQESEEGRLPGLGFLNGKVRKFTFPPGMELPVPHMGWNAVRATRPSRLFPDEGPERFYFVHSYHVVPDHPSVTTAECNYGGEFTCSVERDHIMGVQFHPEKSHRFGMNLMKSFVESLENSESPEAEREVLN